MKKLFALLLVAAMLLTLAACTGTETPGGTTTEGTTTEGTKDDPAVKGEGVMTFAQYSAAEKKSEVTIETYVQGKQGWWEKDGVGVGTFYTQDLEGGYLLYNMPCSKEDYDKIVTGTKLKVKGFKDEWSGEVEVVDATFEILEGEYIAKALDVTSLLGTDDLAKKMNMLVSFKGMTVEAANDEGDAFLYKYNGSGSEGDDLYFNVSLNGTTYTFCVESYLTGSDTDVYKAVKNLKVGDKIDLEGFLYWYNGAQPHIINVTPAK